MANALNTHHRNCAIGHRLNVPTWSVLLRDQR